MAVDQSTLNNPVKLTRRDAKRIGRAAARVERQRLTGARPIYPRGRWEGASPLVLTGEVTTLITAKSGTTMGKGQVTLYETDGEAGTETLSTDPALVFDVYNSFTFSWSPTAGKAAKIHWEGGVWKILDQDC